MPLTELGLRALKPTDSSKKYFDGNGMYLEVRPTGARGWRLKYRFAGKEKLISLGSYPQVTLKAAREARTSALALLAKGVDPSAERRAASDALVVSASNTFESVAREWLDSQKGIWVEAHYERVLSLFENDLLPFLGKRPIRDIEAPELLVSMRRIQRRTLERAHRALGSCGQMFRYAVATGRCGRNPASDLRGALPAFKGKNFAAPTDPKAFVPLLRSMHAYEGSLTVSCALRLAPLVFARPGELRKAKWEDIDFEASEWRYVSSKTKQPHLVPLSRQAIEILREIEPLTGNHPYVFPNARSPKRPMSDNAILAAFRRMDIGKEELTGHGLRATARTILDEVLHFRPDIIEHQLAHAVKDPNGRAYNRTAFIEERKVMMQAWADYLDKIRSTEVLTFQRRA